MIDIYPKILFYTSKYCSPCKPVEKLLEKINLSLFGKKLIIKKIDISENIELIKKENILSVPTVVIGGKKLVSSSIDENDLVDAILQGFLSSVRIEDEDEN